MSKNYNVILFSLACVLSYTCANGQDKAQRIFEQADGTAFTTTATAVNYKNTKVLMIATTGGWIARSEDGGTTWKQTQLKSAGVMDGVQLLYDHKAEVYLAGHSKIGERYQIEMVHSEDGVKWDPAVMMEPADNADRRWVSIQAQGRKQVLYASWIQYDQFGNSDPKALSYVYYSSSSNSGKKWSKPVQLTQTPGDCSETGNTVMGATIAPLMDGLRIFASWSNKSMVFFDRSYDAGVTWLNSDIGVMELPTSWLFPIEGVKDAYGFPITRLDISPRRSNGSLYMAFASTSMNGGDHDIYFTRSTNRGDSWTRSERINKDDKGGEQFSPVIALDPATGNIFIAYFDRRESPTETNVYMSWSVDGGNVFKEIKISDAPISTGAGVLPGRGLSLSVYDGIILAAWIVPENGKTAVISKVLSDAQLNRR